MSSSSNPLVYQPPPPPEVTQQAYGYTTHSGNASVGPLVAALAVITVLGVIAAVVGRLCSGRAVVGIGHYDFEGWAERKCATCIDGRLGPPPPQRQVPFQVGSGAVAAAVAAGGDVEEHRPRREEQKPPDGEKQNEKS